jgi:hypothetical protein
MAKYGFLDVLQEELDKNFSYDYEINWDKKNFAVEVSYMLEIPNKEFPEDPIYFEDAVIFYNPEKSKFDGDDYLTGIGYNPKTGLSREFINYFANFLQDTADNELDDIMDFMDSDEEEFTGKWDDVAFEAGVAALEEGERFPYPRY